MMENSLSISKIKKSSLISESFRKKLVEVGYRRFDGKKLKGDICYDAYFKDFMNGKDLGYTLYCYCYDLTGIIENPEIFEFSFEVQINAGIGMIGLESIQWDFKTEENAEFNIEFFEKKVNDVWKALGAINFPT